MANWDAIVKRLGEEPYLLRPWEVGELTLRQLRVICSPVADVSLEFESAGQMRRYNEQLQAWKSQQIDHLLKG